MERPNGIFPIAARVVFACMMTMAAGLVQALPFSAFHGRLADGTPSDTCTVSGPDKCTMIYNSTLDITILNNWNIGSGTWNSLAPAGSAQALAEEAGVAATGLTGWQLPTGAGVRPAGALNQWLSIWNDVGGTLAGLQAEFDDVPFLGTFWSDSFAGSQGGNNVAWHFVSPIGGSVPSFVTSSHLVVAVRPGDVAAVPEPESLAIVLVGLMAAGIFGRHRKSLDAQVSAIGSPCLS